MNEHEERPSQEDDAIPTLRIIYGFVATIVLTFVCLVWVWAVMKPFENADRGKPRAVASTPPPPVEGQPAVDRTLYNEKTPFSAAIVEQKRAFLDSWGWIDRGKGIIHMPIEKAMKLVVSEAQKRGPGRAD